MEGSGEQHCLCENAGRGKNKRYWFRSSDERSGNWWPIEPEGLYYMSKFLYEVYPMPFLITENGMANLDWPMQDGKIRDYQRIDYMERHLRQAFRAIQDGVDIRGYFHWSFLDNFEWNEGYQKRFGLIYVDYKSQQRIWKESAYRYRKIIETGGECL